MNLQLHPVTPEDISVLIPIRRTKNVVLRITLKLGVGVA